MCVLASAPVCVCAARCHGDHPMKGARTYKCVGVQEHAFAVPSQRPTVDLGKGDAELRTSQGGQAQTVPALHLVHWDDLIEDAAEDAPGGVERPQQLVNRTYHR